MPYPEKLSERGPRAQSAKFPPSDNAFIVTYLENRCKLTLDECIALVPTAEIFQAA
jgi:hypothetical protein